jgi:hypothetical protein
MNEQANAGPGGDLCIRTLAMPADTNANGDIFGGWLLSQMDVGGGVFASKVAKSRTVTVAIEAMNFRKAVYVGDLVSATPTSFASGAPPSPCTWKRGRCAAASSNRFSSPTATSPTSRSTSTAARSRFDRPTPRSRPNRARRCASSVRCVRQRQTRRD